MDESKGRVLLITGSGRSGSTILDNVLGQVPGFFSCGEVRYIWERGFRADRLCGCGRPFSECPFWHDVIGEAFGGRNGVDPNRMIELQNMITRARQVPATLTRGGGKRLQERVHEYRMNLEKLYRAIRSRSGADVVIDSSKLPSYGYVLTTLDSLDVRAVQLVRDARATAHSWGRKKELPDFKDQRYMQRFGPAKAAVLWEMWNGVAQAYWRKAPDRYLRIRYEDFIRAPEEIVRDIVGLFGHRLDEPLFGPNNTIELEANHTVAGNPSRMKTGEIALRSDDEWVRKMSSRNKMVVTAIAWPLLRRYGYPLKAGAGDRASVPSS